MTIFYHSDENCRKGCHVVSRPYSYRGKIELAHLFSIDEPGAWYENEWNVHVDGCDYPVPTKEAAINRGMYVLGYGQFEIQEAGAFYQN